MWTICQCRKRIVRKRPGTITIVRRWIVPPSTVTTTFAVGSFTVPVNAGVLSLVSAVVTATVGATALLLLNQVMTGCLLDQSLLQSLLTISQVTWIWYCPLPSGPATTVLYCHPGKLPSLLNWFGSTCDRIACIDRINHWCIWCCGIYCHHRIFVPTLPAGSVAVTVIDVDHLSMQEAYCPQASRYLTIVRRWIVHTIDSHQNFRSWIVYCAC